MRCWCSEGSFVAFAGGLGREKPDRGRGERLKRLERTDGVDEDTDAGVGV